MLLRVPLLLVLFCLCLKAHSTEDSLLAIKHYHKGSFFWAQKRYFTAIQNFKTSLKYDSTNCRVHYRMSLSYEALRNFDTAKNVMIRAVIIDPHCVEEPFLRLSSLYEKGHDYDSAIFYINKQLTLSSYKKKETRVLNERVKKLKSKSKSISKDERALLVIMEHLSFQGLEVDLNHKHKEVVKMLGVYLQQYDKSVLLKSHCTSIEDSYKALQVAKDRNTRVKSLLISVGVDSKKIKLKNYGRSKPIISIEEDESSWFNNRIEFEIE